jgi:SAM-dependent methyltransferase
MRTCGPAAKRSTLVRLTERPSIRAEYQARGVRGFYAGSGADYRNPHEPQLRRCVRAAVETWRPDLTHVLDLAAGSGEATLALRELGATRVDGIDPYTADAYATRTGNAAEQLTFEDVAAGALSERRYSLIVCSFALHLCEPSRLPAVAQQMSLVAGELLVLTPHKRPLIKPEWGWDPVGEVVVERVRARFYRSNASGGVK